MLDVIKKEAEYKQHLSFRKSEKFIDYLAIIKNVIIDKTNSTVVKQSEKSSILLDSDKINEKKETEKTIEKVENNSQIIEEIKKEDTKQEEIKIEEIKKEEPKKEEVKKVNRKYSEEVIRKSLGLGVKLKSKTK